MAKPPPVTELEFLKLTANHAELIGKLRTLGCHTPDLREYAEHVGTSWFRLGEEHLSEANNLLASGCTRAVYSRAYYAAYNASKGTRYLVKGYVSLRGDDHAKVATDLPDDFPDLANWSQKLTILYEHRLRADYDNWLSTATEQTLSPHVAVDVATAFVDDVRTYLTTKFSIPL